MSRKITIYDYIAETKPADSHFIINKYGKYRRARNPEELAYQLKDFVRTFGDKGLLELAKIHPDRDLIEIECRGCKSHTKAKPLVEKVKEPRTRRVYYNADGKGAKDGQETKLLIIGSLMLIALTIIMKK